MKLILTAGKLSLCVAVFNIQISKTRFGKFTFPALKPPCPSLKNQAKSNGSPGGPLFNNRGEVVGVTTATLNQLTTLKASGSLPQNVNFAVKIDYVIPAIRMVTKDQPLNFNLASQAQEFSKLVSKLESSVVLIVAK